MKTTTPLWQQIVIIMIVGTSLFLIAFLTIKGITPPAWLIGLASIFGGAALHAIGVSTGSQPTGSQSSSPLGSHPTVQGMQLPNGLRFIPFNPTSPTPTATVPPATPPSEAAPNDTTPFQNP